MSKFNARKSGPAMAQSYEGATLYEKSLEEEWVNFIFSSMMQDGFYESADEQMMRYKELTESMIEKYGPVFAAKAARYSRQELGLRSISEYTAAMLNDYQFDYKRQFYKDYFRRPDGVAEVFAAVDSLGSKRSHALVRGAGDYLSSLGEYQISKYKMKGKEYNLFDLINITHAHSKAIDAYKNDTLQMADTWENRISNAGSEEARNENWCDMVETGKLGYLALIRNLNNIVDAAPSVEWIEKHLCPQITNEVSIRKSLVFPYQIYTAYKYLKSAPICVQSALDSAFRTSVANMPELEGSTAIVLDVSASMNSPISEKSKLSIKEAGAVYAAAILYANHDSYFVKFGDDARAMKVSFKSNMFYLIRNMCDNDGCGFGTNIIPAFEVLEKSGKTFDRIFLISDTQVMGQTKGNGWGWGYCYDPQAARQKVNRYLAAYSKTHIYSYDLGNYRTQVTSPDSGRITLLTALNEKVFDMIRLKEQSTSLIDIINNYSYI